jgi:apolipoprotein D and lipocalin family protein
MTIPLLLLLSCASQKKQAAAPLEAVPFVDLTRYIGQWYEISRYPHRFQEGCVGSRATYSMREDGKIAVLNECYEGSFSGKLRNAKGTAKVVDKQSNAKLTVSFFWPFSGDYWIIDLGREYEYAVVGHPSRTYLWILSRTKKMDEKLYKEILERLQAKGYDTTKLISTRQEREGDYRCVLSPACYGGRQCLLYYAREADVPQHPRQPSCGVYVHRTRRRISGHQAFSCQGPGGQ